MKILDKIAFVLFSCIILIASIMLGLLIFGWINLATIVAVIRTLLMSATASNITLGVVTVLILLSIKCIFFDSTTSREDRSEKGILVEDETGKLFISKATMENLVTGVVKSFETAQEVRSKIFLDKENNINVEVTIFVNEEVAIKELSQNMKMKIRETIKKSMDLEVKEVIINVKDITPKTNKGQE